MPGDFETCIYIFIEKKIVNKISPKKITCPVLENLKTNHVMWIEIKKKEAEQNEIAASASPSVETSNTIMLYSFVLIVIEVCKCNLPNVWAELNCKYY